MKRLLIIDRDGTIVKEPPVDFQLDSLEKFEFVPYAISSLAFLRKMDFEMVLASNQDGLGTEAFPTETFLPPHELMLKTLEGEGVVFDDILIDPSLPEDNSPMRKPRTGMFSKYIGGDYDLESSIVVGDRLTDVELAHNLGAKAILLSDPVKGREALEGRPFSSACALITPDWREAAAYIRAGSRSARVERNTSETKVSVAVDLDGLGNTSISTGLGFLDHMLAQIVHHGGVSLDVKVEGDLYVDEHHTVEDTAIALGEALRLSLGDKCGIGRYGFSLPMDECDATVLLDLGGRIDFAWDVHFTRERIGDVPTEMWEHFFKSLCAAMQCNLHISATPGNEHHMIEGVFKAFARALRSAVHIDFSSLRLPSSKGSL